MKGTYVIVRSVNAGVFAGTLATEPGGEVTLSGARRLWYWDGAASLSELAVSGVSKPSRCKFPAEVSSVFVRDVCEILAVSEEAQKSIAEVPVWSA